MTTSSRALASLAVLLLLAVSAAAQMTHHHPASPPPAAGDAQSFGQMMAEAMSRMDQDMAVAPTGNPDRDFAAMMIPHHQGAIDMAKAELQFGRNPVLRRLAEGIIVEQQQEIEVMRRELQRISTRAEPKAH